MKQLESERLIIREWTLNDIDDMYEYGRNELVGPNAGWPPHKNREESKKIIEMFIEEGESLAVELKSTGKVIGGVGLHKRDTDEKIDDLEQLEVGYVLNPDYWGNGYIPEAVERLKKYSFEELKIDVLWCAHYDFNDKSKRVNEKCGFKYQFTKEKVLTLLDNKRVTTLYYSIKNPLKSKNL